MSMFCKDFNEVNIYLGHVFQLSKQQVSKVKKPHKGHFFTL